MGQTIALWMIANLKKRIESWRTRWRTWCYMSTESQKEDWKAIDAVCGGLANIIGGVGISKRGLKVEYRRAGRRRGAVQENLKKRIESRPHQLVYPRRYAQNLKKRIERKNPKTNPKDSLQSNRISKRGLKARRWRARVYEFPPRIRISKRGLKDYRAHETGLENSDRQPNLKKRIESLSSRYSWYILFVDSNLKKRIESALVDNTRLGPPQYTGISKRGLKDPEEHVLQPAQQNRISKRGLKVLNQLWQLLIQPSMNLKKRIESLDAMLRGVYVAIISENLKKRIERLNRPQYAQPLDILPESQKEDWKKYADDFLLSLDGKGISKRGLKVAVPSRHTAVRLLVESQKEDWKLLQFYYGYDRHLHESQKEDWKRFQSHRPPAGRGWGRNLKKRIERRGWMGALCLPKRKKRISKRGLKAKYITTKTWYVKSNLKKRIESLLKLTQQFSEFPLFPESQKEDWKNTYDFMASFAGDSYYGISKRGLKATYQTRCDESCWVSKVL